MAGVQESRRRGARRRGVVGVGDCVGPRGSLAAVLPFTPSLAAEMSAGLPIDVDVAAGDEDSQCKVSLAIPTEAEQSFADMECVGMPFKAMLQVYTNGDVVVGAVSRAPTYLGLWDCVLEFSTRSTLPVTVLGNCTFEPLRHHDGAKVSLADLGDYRQLTFVVRARPAATSKGVLLLCNQVRAVMGAHWVYNAAALDAKLATVNRLAKRCAELEEALSAEKRAREAAELRYVAGEVAFSTLKRVEQSLSAAREDAKSAQARFDALKPLLQQISDIACGNVSGAVAGADVGDVAAPGALAAASSTVGASGPAALAGDAVDGAAACAGGAAAVSGGML